MAKFAAKDSNKNITLSPHGTGKVVVGTGAADATVQSDGNYNLVLQTGNSTTGSISITDGANGNIAITPDGTGEVDISKVDIDGGAIDAVTLGTNSAVTEAQIDNININGNAITSTDTDGNIDLTPNGTGEVNISKVDIDSGTIDGADITVGTGKTLDVQDGTFTTSPAQKQAISATAFASGTKMIFQQSSAPTGWTKDYNSADHIALRVCGSGSFQSGVGGSVAFTTAFTSQSISAHSGGSVGSRSLSTSQMPSHRHTAGLYRGVYENPANASGAGSGQILQRAAVSGTSAYTFYTNYQGSTSSHDHGFTQPSDHTAIDLAVKYVDVIVASKD